MSKTERDFKSVQIDRMEAYCKAFFKDLRGKIDAIPVADMIEYVENVKELFTIEHEEQI